jgi:DNA-binding LytR/AlgR family response regulator
MSHSTPLRCLVVDDDHLSRNVIASFVERHDGLLLSATAESAVEAANCLQESDFDVLFLDVEMPDMSGLELLRSLSERPQVILVTVKEDYAVEAFAVEVTDYLVKPVRYARFLQAVERVQRRLEAARPSATTADEPLSDDYVFIKVDGRLIKLDLTTVRWIEAQGDYVKIQTDQNAYLVHNTMKHMEANLPTQAFARVHRSYIVRIDRIMDIEDTSVVVEGKVIPIGRSYRDSLLSRLRTL